MFLLIDHWKVEIIFGKTLERLVKGFSYAKHLLTRIINALAELRKLKVLTSYCKALVKI